MSNNPAGNATGIYSKYVFDVLLKHEIARTARFPSPLTLLRISLAPNNHPQETQQVALDFIANILNKFLRSSDIPASHENSFLVLLPLTNQEGGQAVCKRLLSRSNDAVTAPAGVILKPNICIGMTWRAGGGDIDAQVLMQEAADALAYAQRQGPQSVVSYAELQQQYLKNF